MTSRAEPDPWETQTGRILVRIDQWTPYLLELNSLVNTMVGGTVGCYHNVIQSGRRSSNTRKRYDLGQFASETYRLSCKKVSRVSKLF